MAIIMYMTCFTIISTTHISVIFSFPGFELLKWFPKFLKSIFKLLGWLDDSIRRCPRPINPFALLSNHERISRRGNKRINICLILMLIL
uniref:Putative ovule protein n=1 Tax=Solanum chacoense TaxID=4108 RepID=A0A0V0HYB2_SOLCH